MRPLKSHFPEHALPTLETVLKQTQEARVFRRAQAVREVVAGHHVNTVSATFHVANSALRKWVQRPAPRRLVAHSAARAPPHTPTEPEPHQTRGVPQTPGVVAVPLLEPRHQWRVAQRDWRGPVWDLQSLLQNRPTL